MSKHDYRNPGLKASEMKAAHQALMDERPLITRCAFCDGWQHEGTAAEGRAQAAEHRLSVHPDVRVTRRRRGSLQRWNPSDDGFRDGGVANAQEVAAMHARRERAA